MTLRSWRGLKNRWSWLLPCLLQWGHDLAVMESNTTTKRSDTSLPLQWGHDLAVMESRQHVDTFAALCRLQWGHDLAVMES